MKIVSKMISLVVAVCVMTSAFLLFQPIQRVEAAEAEFEDVVSAVDSETISYEYEKLSTLMNTYRLVFRITPINPELPSEGNFYYIQSRGSAYTAQYIALESSSRELVVPLEFDGKNSRSDQDRLDILTVRRLSGSNATTSVVLQRKSLGAYEYLGEAYTNVQLIDGRNRLDSLVECRLSDIERYDYFIGYHLVLPRANQTMTIVASIPSENREVFRQSFAYVSTNFGLVKITDSIKYNDAVIRLESHQNNAGDIGAGGIALYRKAKPVSGSISATIVNIGDNTPVPINVSFYTEEASYFEVYNIATGQTLYSGTSGNYAGVVNVNIANEGEIPLGLRARSVDTGGVTFTGNSVWVNKRNMLDEAITNLNAVKSTAQIAVLNDRDRYFEDNAQNRTLVQTILQRAAGTYLIYNDVSPVLTPLLGK